MSMYQRCLIGETSLYAAYWHCGGAHTKASERTECDWMKPALPLTVCPHNRQGEGIKCDNGRMQIDG